MSGTVVYSSDGEWRQRQFTGSGAARPTLEQRPRRRIVACRSAPGISDGGRLRGGMRFHLQRALQQIGLERGDRPIVDCAGTGRPSQDRPSRRGGRCVRPRTVRELLRDPVVRTAGSAQLSQPRRGPHGDLRVGAGLAVAGRVRGQPGEDGCMSTPGVEIHGAQRRHSAPMSPSAGCSPSEPDSFRPATVFVTGARHPERPPQVDEPTARVESDSVRLGELRPPLTRPSGTSVAWCTIRPGALCRRLCGWC